MEGSSENRDTLQRQKQYFIVVEWVEGYLNPLWNVFVKQVKCADTFTVQESPHINTSVQECTRNIKVHFDLKLLSHKSQKSKKKKKKLEHLPMILSHIQTHK